MAFYAVFYAVLGWVGALALGWLVAASSAPADADCDGYARDAVVDERHRRRGGR